MKNRYIMTLKQNLDFVRKNMTDYIYNSMILARYEVTKDFCTRTDNLSEETEEEIALANFYQAYDYLLTTPDVEADYSVLVELHNILMKGLMDSFTNQLTEEQIEELNAMINQPAKANTEIALDVMLHILDKRLFADGDVRVALMFANKIMVNNGCGFITVVPEKCATFRSKLTDYNHTHDAEVFKDWIFKYCIKGKKVYY